MAITINWLTKVINIPKADLTLVQSTPTEIRELNLNSFHLELRDIEDSEEGIVNLKTHTHNTEVSLGGITFARVIEIINGYTITFEDGQYAVNLIGANSNVGDVVNVNQVSVRSQNSAGLISSPDIEYSSFNGGVTIDVTSLYDGTLFPVGTPQQPVNNIDDAKLIAEYRGFTKFYVLGDIVFDSDDDIDGFIVVGQNAIKSHFTLTAGLSSAGCEFNEATIDGTLSGNAFIRNCTVEDLTYVEGQLRECILVGTILLAGNATTNILNCWDGIAGNGKPIIDMGGSGQSLTMGGYSGEIKIINKTGSDKVSIDLLSGEVEIDSTVTDGEIFVRGVGVLVDNSIGTVLIDWSALLSREIYDDNVYVNTNGAQSGIQYPLGTLRYPVNNMTDAKTIADNLGIRSFSLVGSTTLAESFTGYKFKAPYFSAGAIDLDSMDVSGSIFEGISITGNAVGPFFAKDCELLNGMTGIQATLENCVIAGTFTIAAGQAFQCDRCNLKGMANVFDLNGTGQLSIAGVSGVFQITNMSSPASFAAVTGDFVGTLASSCTLGTVLIAGIGQLNDSSTGVTVIDKVLPGATWDELRASHVVTGTFGKTDDWSSASTPADIADAVWDEPMADHQALGSFGEVIEKIKFWVNYLRSVF